MASEEEVDKGCVGDFLNVIFKMNYFSMSSVSIANSSVGWVLDLMDEN